ncbi:MAG: hypothetical protein CVU06_03175 [Bacteroidetes bacterium HGW-Bacteroidetes-22]|nr:MAG: hypothetical protein CVU06_03175 [Bacteroidetes bacterium HGW-Bacteroidetes-22]
MKILRSIVILGLLLSFQLVIGQNIPEKPTPPRLVNDFAKILTTDELNRLESKLVAYSDSTTTQIVVVVVPSLDGYDKADYADRLGEMWGVGTKGSNNGIVVLVKPKTAIEKGEAYISVGYGLEEVIPDATANRIVDNEMISAFRNSNYYAGLDKGTTTIMGLASKLFTAKDYDKKHKTSPFTAIIPILIIAVVLLLMRGSGRRQTIGGSSLPFWATLFLLNGMGSRGHSGSWGDFSGGGGSFGGGGFGGFGGGSFGGGGAGGSW